MDRIHFSLVLLCALLTPSVTRAAEPDWQPKKTWVFAIGVLEWQAKDQFGSFPKKDRRDAELVEFFRKSGVPGGQVMFLVDEKATKKTIESELVKILGQTREGDLFIFYYAGHGVRAGDAKAPTCLANYDMRDTASGLKVPGVIDAIEKNFKGSRVLLTADCCHSGALGVEAATRKSRIAYATLASVEPAGTSTSNWTFTESLLKGLRGDAMVDANGDGKITFAELAAYTEEELAYGEEQLSYSAATMRDVFGDGMVLSIAEKKGGTPGVVASVIKDRFVEIEWNGEWWKGRVTERKGEESFVRYAGYGAEWDEWVKPQRVRALKPATIAEKTVVQIEWSGRWWPGSVIGNKYGLHQVRYDGYGAEWDEWVGPKRVRVQGGAGRGK